MEDGLDMPDFLPQPAAPQTQDADLIDDEEDLEAELEAALEESGDQSAAAQKAPPPLPLRLQQPVVAPLQLAADGYVDEDALTREQRNRLDAEKVSLMTEEQLDRYEAFRRSSLKRPIGTLMAKVLGAKPADKANIALASVAKTFVGELIETARMVAEERGEHGALLPAHIHTAYQQLQQQNKVPPKAKRRRRML